MSKPKKSAGRRRVKKPRRIPQVVALVRDGLAREQHGNLLGAEQSYIEAIELDASDPDLLHAYGLLLLRTGRASEGSRKLTEALAVAPQDPALHNNLANACSELGQFSTAVEHYQQALKLDPSRVSARYNLGKALQNLGQAQAAANCFRRLSKRLAKDADVWTSLGAAELDAGNVQAAESALQTALSLNSRFAPAHHHYGELQLDLGHFETAMGAFRRALDIDPSYTPAAAGLTRCKRFDSSDQADIDRIEKILTNRRTHTRDRTDLHFALGKIYDDQAAYQTAFEHFKAGNDALSKLFPYEQGSAERRAKEIIAHTSSEFFERIRAWPRIETPSGAQPQPLFIVGMQRSGTTLVEQILASHPAVEAGGELPLIGQLAEQDPGAPFPSWLTNADQERFSKLSADYLDALSSRWPDAGRVTDKMPANYLYLGLIAALFPQAHIVHCRRDARDVGLSIYFRQFSLSQGYAFSHRLEGIAAQINAYQALMEHWRSCLPLKFLEVSYEQLTETPEPEIRRILEHCDLDWHSGCLEFHRTERQVHTASAWQVRQPMYRASVARWRHYEEFIRPLTDGLQLAGK